MVLNDAAVNTPTNSSLQLIITPSNQTVVLDRHLQHVKITPTNPKLASTIPFRQIINVSFDPEHCIVSFAYLKKEKKQYALHHVKGGVQPSSSSLAIEWINTVMSRAYQDIKQRRKFLVFVNPHGGPGKARSIYSKKVAPVLEAAGCDIELIYTTKRNHAFEVVKDMTLNYDAIVVLSGDGLIHEVFNGLASHKTPSQALRIPVSPIPTGSGNGMCLNLHGLKDGFDVVFATLCAIKGSPMKIDLFSFVQGDKRTFSFMSQCVGLMADLDLGTENLRWMGDTRFAVGFLRGALGGKFPFELSYKLAEDDKDKMAEAFRQKSISAFSATGSQPHVQEMGSDESFLPLQHLTKESIAKSDDWITMDEPALFLFAGQGPYVSRDYMPFAVSIPDDGLIDLVVVDMSVPEMAISGGMVDGQIYWHPKNRYLKVKAYRVRPHAKKGNLSIDGEAYPFGEFGIEVHQAAASVLSLYGNYVCGFDGKK